MTIQCEKLTINVGEAELFIEVYNKEELTQVNGFKIGDTCFTENKDGNPVEMLWYGEDEEWVAQPSTSTFMGTLTYYIFNSRDDKYNKVIRILNSDPAFNREEYLSNNSVESLNVGSLNGVQQ